MSIADRFVASVTAKLEEPEREFLEAAGGLERYRSRLLDEEGLKRAGA
jgi:hypothetical protein